MVIIPACVGRTAKRSGRCFHRYLPLLVARYCRPSGANLRKYIVILQENPAEANAICENTHFFRDVLWWGDRSGVWPGAEMAEIPLSLLSAPSVFQLCPGELAVEKRSLQIPGAGTGETMWFSGDDQVSRAYDEQKCH